jgi:hypothetical protein
MSLGLNGTNQNEVDAGYRQLRIIWLAFLVSVITLFFITRLVEVTQRNMQIVFWMLLALGVVIFGASFFLKYRMLKQAAEKSDSIMARSAYIIAYALCNATALFGAVAYFVTGEPRYYFFFALSGFSILLHKPQRDDLLAATKGKL